MAKTIYDTARADLAKMQAAHKAKQETAKTELRNVTAEIESLTETLKADASRQDGNAYSSHFIRRSMLNERRNQLERELTNTSELTATEYNNLSAGFRKKYLLELQTMLRELQTAAGTMTAVLEKIQTANTEASSIFASMNTAAGGNYGLILTGKSLDLLGAGYDLVSDEAYTDNLVKLNQMFIATNGANLAALIAADLQSVASDIAAIA